MPHKRSDYYTYPFDNEMTSEEIRAKKEKLKEYDTIDLEQELTRRKLELKRERIEELEKELKKLKE